ncbi:MAG: tetratricopeptide repeat protein, partial [Candidatus Methanoperedens sp.]|nr:tetratricopeptide repeat protein [Candidatus Methanoperedens sp.]
MCIYGRIFGKKISISDSSVKEAVLSGGGAVGAVQDNARINTEDVSVWVNKGNERVEGSMYAEAIQCYDKLLEINPLDAAAWCIKGDV